MTCITFAYAKRGDDSPALLDFYDEWSREEWGDTPGFFVQAVRDAESDGAIVRNLRVTVDDLSVDHLMRASQHILNVVYSTTLVSLRVAFHQGPDPTSRPQLVAAVDSQAAAEFGAHIDGAYEMMPEFYRSDCEGVGNDGATLREAILVFPADTICRLFTTYVTAAKLAS